MALITDITGSGQGNLKLSQRDLTQMFADGISVSDIETTGLNRERNGLTEFGSTKAIAEKDARGRTRYRQLLFNSFILPLRPEFQDYLKEKALAKKLGEPAPLYNPDLYEYQIDASALNITGTRFTRDGVRGPIIGMELRNPDGTYRKVDAKPFYEIADDVVDFMNPHDVYYNAPFDKPFLNKQLRDVYAHRILSGLREGNVAVGEPFGLKKEALLKIAATHTSFTTLRHAFAQQLQLPAKLSLDNPAQYRCLLYAYLYAQGAGASNRLDDAFRTLVDPAFTERQEHTAQEDILMATKVALALREKLGGFPSMAELYQRILSKADAAITVSDSTSVDQGMGAAAGDLLITFPRPASELTGRALDYWNLLADFQEVHRRNARSPRHLRDVDPQTGRVYLSAERKTPLILTFLKKLMLYERMLEGGPITRMLPYDSVGNKIDVMLAPSSQDAAITIEDTHYGSVRANLPMLAAYPEHAAESIEFIRDLRNANRKIGTILLPTPDASPDQNIIVIKTHQRALGDVRIHLPAGYRISDAKDKILQDIQILCQLGMGPEIFGVRVNENESAEEELEGEDATSAHRHGDEAAWLQQSIMLHDDTLRVAITPRLFDVLARQVGIPPDAETLGSLKIIRQMDHITLEGNLADFQRKLGHMEIETYEGSAFRAIRDISWLMHRLKNIAGTTDVVMEGHMATLMQYPHLSTETLEALYRAGIPFKAYNDRVRVDFEQLLHDGFYWSNRLARAHQDMQRSIESNSESLPFYGELQKALLQGDISAIETDETCQLYALENTKPKKGEPVHHALIVDDRGHINIQLRARKFDPVASSIMGPHRPVRVNTSHELATIELSGVMAQWLERYLKRHEPTIEYTNKNNGNTSLFSISHAALPTVQQRLSTLSLIMHTLQTTHGLARPASGHMSMNGNVLTMHMPQMNVLRESMTGDLSRLAGILTDSTFTNSLQKAIAKLPKTSDADRRRDHLGPYIEALDQSAPDLMALTEQLDDIQLNIRNLNFEKRFLEELGEFSTLIHELAALQDQQLLGADAKRLFQQVIRVRKVVAEVAYGLERLDEAMNTMHSTLTGGGSRTPIYILLGDALIQDSERLLLAAIANQPREERLGKLETKVLFLYHKGIEQSNHSHLEESEIHIQACKRLQKALEDKAFHYLLALGNADADKAEDDKKLAHLLITRANAYRSTKSKRQHSLNADALLAIYANPDACTNRLVIAERALAVDSTIKPAIALEWADSYLVRSGRMPISQLIEQLQAELPEAVRKKYQHEAEHVIKTLLTMRDYDDPANSEKQYWLKARAMMQAIGKSEQDIEATLRHASTRTISSDAVQKAAIRLQKWSARTHASSDIAHIFYQESASEAYHVTWQRLHERDRHYCSKISQSPPPYYPELKLLRDGLLRRMEDLKKEANDLLTINYHNVIFLRDAMHLLKDAATIEPTIGRSLDHPIHALHESQDRLQAIAAKEATQNLSNLGLQPTLQPDGGVACDVSVILQNPEKWLKGSQRKPEKKSGKQTELPLLDPAPLTMSDREMRRRVMTACAHMELPNGESLVESVRGSRIHLKPCPPENVEAYSRQVIHALARAQLVIPDGISPFTQIGQPDANGLLAVASKALQTAHLGVLATPQTAKIFLHRFARDTLQIPAASAKEVIDDAYARTRTRSRGLIRD
ncbi:MAG: hypothetical protein K2Q12_00265 [Rickettsiales bacterium]|nr:hypothetical protein [Rickettsiales bacterium]